MARERSDQKADRLLLAGKVRVVHAVGRDVRVVVEGDHDTYFVEHHAGQWSCSCASWRCCSHRIAARTVTAPVVGPWVVNPELQIAMGDERRPA